jgi:cytochrome c
MTEHKHFKALVRGRAAKTGERYSIARKHLLDQLDAVEPRLVAEFEAHDQHCNAVRFTPDGRRLLTGGFRGQARLWSTDTWTPTGELVGHRQSVNGFAVGLQRAVTVSSDGTVRLWDLDSLQELAVLSEAGKQVVAVDIASDGSHAWTGGYDGSLRRWTIDGRPTLETKLESRVVSLAVHPDHELIAAGLVGADLIVQDDRGGMVKRLAAPGEATVSIRWTDEGSLLLAAGPAGRIRMWAADTWEVVRESEAPGGGVMPMAVGSDRGLVALGWEHHIGLWRPDTDEPLTVIDGLPKGVYSLDFAPDGRMLAQGGADGKVRVWRV